MSPQRSNRQALLEGALRCLEESPSARITARQIAAAAGANTGSIKYHFGSTDALLVSAMQEGFQQWLRELTAEMGDVEGMAPFERVQQASKIVTLGMRRHSGLVRAFLGAIARAMHDERLRATLAESYRESRREVAALLGFGDDEDAALAATIVLATFDGLLIRAALDRDGAIGPDELLRGIARMATATQGQP